MTSKRNKLEDLLQHLDSSTAMQQRIPDAVRERILNNVIKETNDAEVEAPRKSDSAHPAMDPARRTRRWQWPAVAAALAAIVMAVILPTRILQGVPAVLEDAEGKRSIQYGELVRPAGDKSAMLSMTDGSRVETRSMSEFSLERMDDGGTRIRLKEGGLIVDASAKNQSSLSVQTKDITALVGGAVSLVNAEEDGSRIAAIGGEISVQQGTTEKRLRPGEQVATSPVMELIPVKEELTWSRQAAEHVAMLEQTQSSPSGSAASATRLKFAVASVRPTLPALPPGGPVARGSVDADLMGLGIKCLGADGLLGVAPNVQDPTARRGRCTANSVDIREVILRAYPLTSSTVGNRLVGFPQSGLGPFQIEGVADEPERVTKGELQQMLQALLEDRFKLRVHLETREVDGYTLTIAKSGIKFKEPSGDARCRVNYGRGPNPANPGVSGTCPMGQLTTFLMRVLNPGGPPPFEDKTGLMGTYNMEFALEEVFAPPTATGVRGVATQQARQFTTPIPKALEEQLGLHLERAKVPTEFVVIDHIEQPTEN